jgi:hypothetical protein
VEAGGDDEEAARVFEVDLGFPVVQSGNGTAFRSPFDKKASELCRIAWTVQLLVKGERKGIDMKIPEELKRKGADISRVATRAIKNPELIPELIEGLMTPKGTLRYGYEKVLRLISEQRPALVYPYFDIFAGLLDSPNSFLKWGAILTIANLAVVDSEKRFEKLFRKYYSPITGPVMVTAANVIGGSVKIASAKPELTERITREILKVEKAEFKRRDSPSPECRNVAIGQAIDSFDKIFDQIKNQAPIIKFVKRQLKNSRKAVVTKAEKFLERHGI